MRRALGGLAFFRQMAAGGVRRAPMVALLDFRLVEVEEGRAVFMAQPTDAHYNGLGIVHGGLAASLLDTALGVAINTMAPQGRIFTTLEMKVNFTRALRREVGPVRCEARVIHVGTRVGTAEARLVDAAGTLYAHGTATCILFEPTRRSNRRT
jgi:uncharacterized protein (TIGR00369 family)